MKRTTYIMASMILAGILGIVGLFAMLHSVATDYNTYSNDQHIQISGPMNTVQTEPFRQIELNYQSSYYDNNSPYASIYFRELGNLVIQESDSVKVPEITMNCDWNEYMSVEVTDNTLHMTISVLNHKHKKNFHVRGLTATDPITVTLPAGTLNKTVCATPHTVMLRDVRADSLNANICCELALTCCNIKNLNVYQPSDNSHTVSLNSSVIDRLELSSYDNNMNISGTSDSRIGTLVCPSIDNTVLNTHATRINRFDWAGGDSISLRLHTDADISFSTAK